MATETTFLGLTLAGLGEYTDSWDRPVNANFMAIDNWANSTNTEVVAARFNLPTLSAFLAVAHNSDGSLQSIPEVVSAHNSPIYGNRNTAVAPITDYTLSQRMNFADFETLGAREGQESLRDGIASRESRPNQIMSGAADANGFPTWLSASGAGVQIHGEVTPLWLMIGGHMCRIRTQKNLDLTGNPSGWYYLYAEYQATGLQTVDGDSRTPPPSAATGSTTTDAGDPTQINRFNDQSVFFSGLLKTLDIQVGDILNVFSPSAGTLPTAGQYVIKTLGDGDEHTLKIIGAFPGSAPLSGLNYEIRDPLAVTVGFTATKISTPGRIYLGEVYMDSGSISTSSPNPLRPYHFKDTYVGDWRQIVLSSGTPTLETIWEHRLGSDVLDVSVQVSQVNDGSAFVEELSVANIINTLSPVVTQPSIAVSDGKTLTPSTPQVLGGTITAAATGSAVSLSGSVVPSRSAAVKWTRNQIFVTNATPQLLYVDYSGTQKTTGYMRVVVRRRG